MAVGQCGMCGHETHVEWFDDRWVEPGAYLCLACEAQAYRSFFNCPHFKSFACSECEAKSNLTPRA